MAFPQIYLPVDPAPPILVDLYQYLVPYSGTEGYGRYQVKTAGENTDGERTLVLSSGEGENINLNNAPSPSWRVPLVLSFNVPSQQVILAGPNRGKQAQETAHWWYYAMLFVQKTEAFLRESHDHYAISSTDPVSSGVVSDELGIDRYEYRIPLIAQYTGDQ